ncbi:hypothetical protein ACIBQ6_06265 [Nonomuraea sp. NPDC049655]|uniref:hypothetical protein n=1 Tax=Nonomuraea sp. NPDC049655 TaxID=3364355 RepID=UPI0037BAE9CD
MSLFVQAFVTLLVIFDPLAAIPIFLTPYQEPGPGGPPPYGQGLRAGGGRHQGQRHQGQRHQGQRAQPGRPGMGLLAAAMAVQLVAAAVRHWARWGVV